MRLVTEGVNDMEERGFKVRPEVAREAVAYVFGATEAVGSPDKIIYSSAKAKQVTKRVEEILKKGRVKKNPVKSRKGETERKFVSRCMSEEKQSFPKLKQRIAVCLSKARKNPLLESGATISKNSGINRRAASMT